MPRPTARRRRAGRPTVAARGPQRLGVKEEIFVREYLSDRDFNATKAALRAGYAKSSASVTAHILLHRPSIVERIQKILHPILKAKEVTADRVITELAVIALLDRVGLRAWGATVDHKLRALELLTRLRHLDLLPTTRVIRDAQGRVGVEVPGGGVENVIIYLPDNGRDPLPPGRGPIADPSPDAIQTSHNGNPYP
jgi:hypothetical protein